MCPLDWRKVRGHGYSMSSPSFPAPGLVLSCSRQGVDGNGCALGWKTCRPLRHCHGRGPVWAHGRDHPVLIRGLDTGVPTPGAAWPSRKSGTWSKLRLSLWGLNMVSLMQGSGYASEREALQSWTPAGGAEGPPPRSGGVILRVPRLLTTTRCQETPSKLGLPCGKAPPSLAACHVQWLVDPS